MKKFIAGTIFGALLVLSTSVFADGTLEQVTAYLRPNLPVTLDGKPLELKNPPIIYDGSTYLQLRDTAAALGKNVNWNDATQTVELSDVKTTANTYDSVTYNAIEINGIKYLNLHDISELYRDKGFRFVWNDDTQSFDLRRNEDQAGYVEKDKVLLKNIKCVNSNGNSYIAESFFQKEILPILSK